MKSHSPLPFYASLAPSLLDTSGEGVKGVSGVHVLLAEENLG